MLEAQSAETATAALKVAVRVSVPAVPRPGTVQLAVDWLGLEPLPGVAVTAPQPESEMPSS